MGNILALDVPGCGVKRGRKIETISTEDVARELIGDLQNAGLKDIVLTGHSQGGQIMALMAALKPALFRRMIFVSCSLPLPGQTVLQMIGTGVHGSNKDEVGWPCDPKTTDTRRRLHLMLANDMLEEQEAAFFAKLGKDNWPPDTYRFTDWRTERLSAMSSTYVICMKDGILPVPWQEEFARRFRTKRQIRIDAGHQVMTTRPEALAEIIRQESLGD